MKLTGGEKMELNAKKLRFIMARKEVGVRELAEKAGISAAAVSRYTRGITKPSIKSLGKIANALDVEVEEIIEDEKEKEQTPTDQSSCLLKTRNPQTESLCS